MKAKQLKRIVDFILLYHPSHTNKSVRALFKLHPEQFLELLSNAIEQTEVIPKSVVNFIRESSKQTNRTPPPTSPNQDELIIESPTMNNQKKPSFIMRIVALVKRAWAKATNALTNNASKGKVLVSAVVFTVIAIVTSKGTATLTLIAALKSRGILNSATSLFPKAVSLLKSSREAILSQISMVTAIIKIGGLVALDKAIALKNFILSKAKQAWYWVLELFATDTDNTFDRQAA